MLPKKIIPCLDIRDGRVVKGVKFKDIQDVNDPVELAKVYTNSGADEIVFYDIFASTENRVIFLELLKKVAAEVKAPLTAGGNIKSLSDFERVFAAGATKASINSGAIVDPTLIEQASKEFGRERIVFAMDAKRADGKFKVFTKGGQEQTELDAIEWAVFGAEHGAGEIVINSIDADGTKDGFDIEMLLAITARVSTPVVASGGAGTMADFKTLFESVPGVSTGLAASVFHFGEIDIRELKQYLNSNGIAVKI